ncbi:MULTISPECIES: DUF2127 domain-containing protein [Oleiagrimonas]|uniref:DUF2127 domain-containing protein n=1 Tax=Oleiagrimonas citrea TaxID=1665687 RepID=A0A846ZQ51_9GAMM|nr:MULTISPECIES: DUF2127 domain-containing protein [Oleiagrimonas]NKZ40136.1 DUF2127 domain-containing protein [Oleiagrimonas citrea]RAP57073.1 hypothetical protein BTJ49_10870 [Oleiagrimonas sp. MCCC 1A03011]
MDNPPKRSTFVTVVAWIFIILAGFATLIGTLQNILFATLMKGPAFDQAMHDMPHTSPVMQAIWSHFQLIAVVMLILAVMNLIASIGLLKRRNWARLLFIGLLGVGIAWQLAGMVLQHFAMASMQTQFADVPNMPDMHAFMTGIYAFAILQGLAISGVFIWIILRLISPRIRAEFAS